MITKMGPELSAIVKRAYHCDLPIMIVGTHGLGKSEMFEQVAADLKIGCIVNDLSIMEPPDLMGIPRGRNGRTVYEPPTFLPTGGKGLFVIEEINRADHFMRAPCLQLLTARRLNDYRLPKGWLPVAAVNPSGDAYEVHEMDPALLSRFSVINVEPDLSAWVAWALENNVDQRVVDFVENTPDIFSDTDPRSWTYVSKSLAPNGSGRPVRMDLNLLKFIAGYVGDDYAEKFMAYHSNRSETSITANDVFQRYQRIQGQVRGWKKAKRTDLLSDLAHKVMLAIQDPVIAAKIKRTNTCKNRLADFIKDLPPDLGGKVKRKAQEANIH